MVWISSIAHLAVERGGVREQARRREAQFMLAAFTGFFSATAFAAAEQGYQSIEHDAGYHTLRRCSTPTDQGAITRAAGAGGA